MSADSIIKEIKSHANIKGAERDHKFYKCFKGGYGEGDKFLGVTSPVLRQIITKYKNEINTCDVELLIKNEFHEIRFAGLVALISLIKKTGILKARDIYLQNLDYINNWDLVDISAPHVLGRYSFESKDFSDLHSLSDSGCLWRERVSVISTLFHVRTGRYFDEAVKLCEKFLEHKHDLMHKACGWVLREVGKKDVQTLKAFLDKYSRRMPRTMLRYSLEKLTSEEKAWYMQK